MSMFASPSTAGPGIQWEDHKGALLLVNVKSFEPEVNTRFGVNDAVKADVAVIDGPGEGETYDSTLIFPKILVTQTSDLIGQKVLGRLTQGEAKSGQSAPWKLEPASEADTALAEQWVARNQPALAAPAAPF